MRRALAWSLLAVATLAAGALYLRERLLPPLPVIATLPHFALTERDGSEVGLAELAGAPWVADFVFTRCQLVCPRLTEKMAELRRRLGDRSRVRSVSITVDPEFDTPEVLARYAREHGIEGGDWLFLTGDKPAVRRLIREGFLLPVEDAPEVARMPILHSDRFVLVDSEGRIRGLYSPFEDGELERLTGDVDRLLREERRAS
jgi:protein SCO1/2